MKSSPFLISLLCTVSFLSCTSEAEQKVKALVRDTAVRYDMEIISVDKLAPYTQMDSIKSVSAYLEDELFNIDHFCVGYFWPEGDADSLRVRRHLIDSFQKLVAEQTDIDSIEVLGYWAYVGMKSKSEELYSVKCYFDTSMKLHAMQWFY